MYPIFFSRSEEAMIIDPLELESQGTETFSDEEYSVTTKIDGRERHDMVRVRIALIPADVAGREREWRFGLDQGFYIMRNEPRDQGGRYTRCLHQA